MNAASAVDVALHLLQQVLGSKKLSDSTIKIADEAVPLLEGAIANLLKLRGSTVTFGQLEGLQVSPKFK